MASSTPTTGWGSLSNLGKFGVISSGFGAVQGAIGSYYAASAEKYKTKSLALNLEHQKNMALFNMRMKESQAQHLSRAYNKQIQARTLAQGDSSGKRNVMFAARGIQRGVGSTRDVFVSDEIMKELDKITMNSNRVRAVEDKRLEAVGLGIKANQYGVGASNMFATASSISPWMNMSSSLLTGAGSFMSSLPTNLLIKG